MLPKSRAHDHVFFFTLKQRKYNYDHIIHLCKTNLGMVINKAINSRLSEPVIYTAYNSTNFVSYNQSPQ